MLSEWNGKGLTGYFVLGCVGREVGRDEMSACRSVGLIVAGPWVGNIDHPKIWPVHVRASDILSEWSGDGPPQDILFLGALGGERVRQNISRSVCLSCNPGWATSIILSLAGAAARIKHFIAVEWGWRPTG